MSDLRALVLMVGAPTAVLGAAVYIGYLADHTEEIARSWADGMEWLYARRDGLYVTWDTTTRTARAAALWVLCAVLRAHGRHRAGVTA
ncbi:hypothetical protein [Streptomyces sp. NPDC020983]|uniref:hypothetical protein n=1 Tax=Streptomyces sp. NPDC020983 TaxID=3365106 RepID=UPI0037939455